MPEGSPSRGFPPLARRPFGRPPISLALVGLVTLLTAATGAMLGALAWRESPRGRVFIATGEGLLVAAPGGVDAAGRATREDAALVGEVMKGLGASVSAGHAFERGGERYLGRAAAFPVGDRQWVTAVVVPERDLGSDEVRRGGAGGQPGRADRVAHVGPQVLLSEATLDRVRHLVSVVPGSHVAVKGVPEPVTVYALTSVAGEEAMDAPDEGRALAEVDLPAVARVVGEGKRVDETLHQVRVTRISRMAVEFIASTALPATHSDLMLAIDFGDGRATEGSYVRVATREPSDRSAPAGTRIRAVFTSLTEADRAHIDRLVDAGTPRTGGGGLTPQV